MMSKLFISQLENEDMSQFPHYSKRSRLKVLLIMAIEKSHRKDQVIARLLWFC